ncbi:keywimysin-related RiPP [Streptomyces litchfieldiae]|uniref:Keywimysin-related RiPP n=1 Tax=Streptomyces litchfieldiae TaxID=3075543 RepID=A0ABU2MQ87_9ACTN|nr:keywimysin-related RiPP [Streptomyces sp. DSM 44938]MDT0343787.1 keywimysin-related RiPP [Streptomyces sp. DSM 44938]
MAENETTTEPQTYEAPALVELGAFAEVTAGTSGNSFEFLGLQTGTTPA